MVCHHELASAIIVELPPQRGEACICLKQPLGGNPAEADDERRLDEVDLPEELWRTRFHLRRQRVPVVGRPAFQDIADVHFFALQPDGRKDFVEQLAGPADKRLSLRVLIGTGRFTDKHHPAVRIANAKDKPRACLSEGTFQTFTDLRVQRIQGIGCDPRLIGEPFCSGGPFSRRGLLLLDNIPEEIFLLHKIALNVIEKSKNVRVHEAVLFASFRPGSRGIQPSEVQILSSSRLATSSFDSFGSFSAFPRLG